MTGAIRSSRTETNQLELGVLDNPHLKSPIVSYTIIDYKSSVKMQIASELQLKTETRFQDVLLSCSLLESLVYIQPCIQIV